MRLITLTPAALGLLEAHRVYDAPRGGRRWRAGEPLALDPELELEPYCHLLAGHVLPRRMGAFSYSHSPLAAHAEIGRYCSIGVGLAWMQGNHPMGWATTSPVAYDAVPLQGVEAFFRDVGAPYRPREAVLEPYRVQIGHDVWIGDGAMLGPRVAIGHGAVIGARALVLKDVPPYALVGGAPARIIRYRFPEPLIERLLALQWWRYAPDVLQAADMTDPERFAGELPGLVEARGARELNPRRLTFGTLRAALEAPPPPPQEPA